MEFNRTSVVVLLVVASLTIVGALSYTTATVSRDATITMDADASAIIGLQGGNAVDSTGDAVVFDFDNANALNTDAQFVYGDNTTTDFTASSTSYAFSVTNNDDQTQTFSFEYVAPNDGNVGTADVTFEVYSPTGGTALATFSEEATGPTALSSSTAANGGTVYVVVIIDTNGQTSADDLSGTLTISA